MNNIRSALIIFEAETRIIYNILSRFDVFSPSVRASKMLFVFLTSVYIKVMFIKRERKRETRSSE